MPCHEASKTQTLPAGRERTKIFVILSVLVSWWQNISAF